MATGPEVNEENPVQGKLSPEDEQILKQPYAKAVSFLGHSADLVVYAVKMLHKQQAPIEAGNLLEQVEKLKRIKEDGGVLPSLEEQKRPERQRLGSEGSEGSEVSESGQSSAREDDLQADGEQPVSQHRMPDGHLPETGPREGGVQKKKEDKAALQRKLKALRRENQLLKARQMCRSCRRKPVSITFLPCGHYSHCYDCGQKFDACPVCQKTILADVRTFLA